MIQARSTLLIFGDAPWLLSGGDTLAREIIFAEAWKAAKMIGDESHWSPATYGAGGYRATIKGRRLFDESVRLLVSARQSPRLRRGLPD